MKVEFAPDVEAALEAMAKREGLSAEEYLQNAVRDLLKTELQEPEDSKLRKAGYGLLAKYGPAPSMEDIEEVRRDMWQGFGESLDF